MLALEEFGLVLPFGIDGSAMALLTSLTLFISISLLTKPQPLPPDVEAVMEI